MSQNNEPRERTDREPDACSGASANETCPQDPIAEFLRSIGSPGFGSAHDVEVAEPDG